MLGVKRRSRNRETIIALRATHTAHRVATAVGYPALTPKPVRAAQPVEMYDPERTVPLPPFHQHGVWWHGPLIVLVLLLFMILARFLFW